MKEDFIVHNLFWRDINEFERNDPHLSRLLDVPYVYHSRLEAEIPVLTPGIYILTGGRQVGKSTLLKLIIKRILKEEKIPVNQIYYLPCDTIEDFKGLLFEIEQFRLSLDPDKYFVICIDEVCFVKEWERAIKSLADSGFLNKGCVIITGSDMFVLKQSMMMFPGRRGESSVQDFHLYPLSFNEYISLIDYNLYRNLEKFHSDFQKQLEIKEVEIKKEDIDKIYNYFTEYILTGGFMPAINSFSRNKTISPAIYKTYVQWIIGDILKRGKQEIYLREVISALIPRLTRQITWHNITAATSIEHHQTVADYINLFCRTDVTNILYALREDRLQPSLKKAKKVNFNDPFIFHALHGWVRNEQDFFNLSNNLIKEPSDLKNTLIEGTIASLLQRNWETYYIKAEGEVDVAIIHKGNFFPIEIKNSFVLREKDLKQILKYNRGLVSNIIFQITKYEHLYAIPIPLLAFIA